MDVSSGHDAVFISAISTIGGVFIAGLTVIGKRRVDANKTAKQPKDRMERMFDGYERLIKQKDAEDERKTNSIKMLTKSVADLEHQLLYTKNSLGETTEQLRVSRKENQELKSMLDSMRTEYKRTKQIKSDSV